MINEDGEKVLVEWRDDVIESYFLRNDDAVISGDSSLIVAKFSDGREYAGQHKNYTSFHGYGVEIMPLPEGPCVWKGEVLIEEFVFHYIYSHLFSGTTKERS